MKTSILIFCWANLLIALYAVIDMFLFTNTNEDIKGKFIVFILATLLALVFYAFYLLQVKTEECERLRAKIQTMGQ